MKYSSKLLLVLTGLAAVSNGLLLFFTYRHAEDALLRQMDTTALSIAATASVFIDGDLHRQLKERKDEESDTYKNLVLALRKVRDVNRRPDLELKYVYTLSPDPTTKGRLVFTLDAEEEGEDKSHIGDVQKYKNEDVEPTVLDRLQVQPDFIEDQWGKWLSANAPIRDSTGQAVAALGVDVNAADVTRKLDSLMRRGLIYWGISVVLAGVVALYLARRAARPLAALRQALVAVGAGDLEAKVAVQSRDEFGEVAQAVNQMIAGLRQRDMFKGTLVRYMSSQMTDRIMDSGVMPELKGERRKITVLFADVRSFTTLSESLSPEEVVSMLNDYFEKMIDAISLHHGMMNKFIGDGLMAIFGALEDDPYQEENAIRAALEMRQQMVTLSERLLSERQLDLRIGIGINTGMAIVGNIGSKSRMEFTAIGDTVNLASRLESASKELKQDIVLSEYTYVAARNRFHFVPLGPVNVKGRADAVSVYTVTRESGPQVSPVA